MKKEKIINPKISKFLTEIILKRENTYQDLIDLLIENQEIDFQIEGIEFNGCKFINVDFSKYPFENISIIDCIFKNCNLVGCSFSNQGLHRSIFENCNLVGCDFISSSLIDISILNSKCNYINFSDSKIKHFKIENSILKVLL